MSFPSDRLKADAERSRTHAAAATALNPRSRRRRPNPSPSDEHAAHEHYEQSTSHPSSTEPSTSGSEKPPTASDSPASRHREAHARLGSGHAHRRAAGGSVRAVPAINDQNVLSSDTLPIVISPADRRMAGEIPSVLSRQTRRCQQGPCGRGGRLTRWPPHRCCSE